MLHPFPKPGLLLAPFYCPLNSACNDLQAPQGSLLKSFYIYDTQWRPEYEAQKSSGEAAVSVVI